MVSKGFLTAAEKAAEKALQKIIKGAQKKVDKEAGWSGKAEYSVTAPEIALNTMAHNNTWKPIDAANKIAELARLTESGIKGSSRTPLGSRVNSMVAEDGFGPADVKQFQSNVLNSIDSRLMDLYDNSDYIRSSELYDLATKIRNNPQMSKNHLVTLLKSPTYSSTPGINQEDLIKLYGTLSPADKEHLTMLASETNKLSRTGLEMHRPSYRNEGELQQYYGSNKTKARRNEEIDPLIHFTQKEIDDAMKQPLSQIGPEGPALPGKGFDSYDYNKFPQVMLNHLNELKQPDSKAMFINYVVTNHMPVDEAFRIAKSMDEI